MTDFSPCRCEFYRRNGRFMRLMVMGIAVTLVASAAVGAECGGNLNQIELDQCYGRVYQRVDSELNGLYRRLSAKLAANPDTKDILPLLETAERAWIGFRDKECDFETALTRGGTIHSMEVTICRSKETGARVKELQRQLDCPEGDLSCVP